MANLTVPIVVTMDEDEIIVRLKKDDFVQVVRCKDCIHHKDAPKTTDVWCNRLDGLLPEDWFCADGERRTDAGT